MIAIILYGNAEDYNISKSACIKENIYRKNLSVWKYGIYLCALKKMLPGKI